MRRLTIVAVIACGVGAASAATAATTGPPIVSEPLTTVVEVNEDPATLGPVFDGVGGNSAGGGTRLLLDYPEHVRSDILDLLFKPQFGASLQHLKVEIGSDGDTTEGAEPTHARNHSDLSFDRGYEVWFLQQAVQRRPDMQLSGLLFGVPGWIRASAGGMWGAASVKYLVDWVSGLRSQKGLNVTSLGVAYNERSYNSGYIKTVRKALDSAGFKTVKTIAPDSWARMWAIVEDMHNDSELAAAVDIIGTHCPGAVNGHPENQPPSSTMALGKPLWSTEQHIGEATGSNALRGGITASLPIWDWHAALMLARVLNQGYITANQTSTLIWTPTWSWSDYIWYAGKGLVVANTPWSGHYIVPDALWLVAHTTQAVQPGWRFVQPGTRMLADGLGSVCSYISPDGTELSIVVETANSLVNNTLKLVLHGSLVSLRNLVVWRSVAGDVFKKQRALQLDNATATLVVLPGAVYTLTTTTGMQKGGENLTVPPSSNFSLPHFDSFESYQPLTTPKFTSDMHGAFTVDAGALGKVLRQRTLIPPDCTHCGASTNYVTTMGDGSLVDYSLRVSGRLLPADTAPAGTDVGYLFVASHIGVKQEYPEVKAGNLTAKGCSISKGTGQICHPPYCSVPMCSLGKQGFAPSSLHSSLTIPGFILQLSWNGSGWNGARWTVHAGAGGCGQLRPFGECPSRTVANGSLPAVSVGSWVDLELTAKRGASSRDSTTLTAAVNGQHLGTWAIAQVSEARGAIAFGNSMSIPVSEWDNLSLTLAQNGHAPQPSPQSPRPPWPFSWDRLSVWASGQGVTDFSDADSRHLARFDIVWTQGMRWNPPPSFAGDYVPFSPPRAGYTTWESATISDAKKLHAIKPGLPVLGYYGWGGCCTGGNEWWLSNYTHHSNSALWLRDDTGRVVLTGDKPSLFRPVFDLCNVNMVDYLCSVVLRDFIESDEISGSFFDSVTSYTGLGRFGSHSGYKNASFGEASRQRLDTCWQVAMVNVSRYMLARGKVPVMSTTALLRHPEQGGWPTHQDWDTTTFEMLKTVGGFRYIEALCPLSWKVYGNESTVQTCVDQILTLQRDARAGIPLMVRADSTNHTEHDQAYFNFTLAVFLMVAENYSYFAGGLHGHDGWCGPLCFPWFPSYDRPLGSPLGPAVATSATAWSRTFSKLGEVTVNVSEFSSCFDGSCSTAGTHPPSPPHPAPPGPPGPPSPKPLPAGAHVVGMQDCSSCNGTVADSVVVVGAGTSACNGIFNKSTPPPHVSGPWFQKDAQHMMYAFQNKWRIGVLSKLLDYTSDVVSPDGPPKTGWEVGGSSTTGTVGKAPAPRLECQPASSTITTGSKWYYDTKAQHIVLSNTGGASLCIDTSGGNVTEYGPVKVYSCGTESTCDNQRLHYWQNDTSIRWTCNSQGPLPQPMCLWQTWSQNSSAHVATMRTCAADDLVTDPAGRWEWGAPTTAAAAAPLINNRSGQCLTIHSTGPAPPSPGPHPPPPPLGPDVSPPQVGDALTTATCVTNISQGLLRQTWVACTGLACWPPGSPDAEHRMNIQNNASGELLCLDSVGGAPGWAARVWPCQTSNWNASNPWNPGGRFNPDTNMVTSSTWRLHVDGTLRTNVSKVASPTNASGEVCLHDGLPAAATRNLDFYSVPGPAMWWCDGSPSSIWNLSSDGKLISVASGKCMTATSRLKTNHAGGRLPKCDAPSPIPPPAIKCTSCSAPPCSLLPFCNASLSAQARAEDMVSRMSNEEKGWAMMGKGVPRLTGASLSHIDGLHGIDGQGCYDLHGNICWDRSNDPQCENAYPNDRRCVPKPTPYPNLTTCRCATSFPSLVGVGATFNRSVFSSVGEVLSDEARALHNMKVHGAGLLFWTPDINLARNVLWGRNQETPGEDPLLNGLVGKYYTLAGQGGVAALNWSAPPQGPPMKTAWSIKHYLAYDVECSSGGAGAHFALTEVDNGSPAAGMGFDCQAPGVDRFHMNANLTEPDLIDYYGEVFRRALSAGVSAIMCAFPSVNGTPACANGLLQNHLARETYGFDGFFTTDCGALPFTNQDHYMSSSPTEAFSIAVKNGLDCECGEGGPQGPGFYINWGTIHDSLTKGLINNTDLDTSAIRLWRTAIKMGLLEEENPWSELGFETLDSTKNQEASYQAAVQSMVLLQNNGRLLPLDLTTITTLAVVGPYTFCTQNIKGDYTGPNIRVLQNSIGTRLQARAKDFPSTSLIYAAGTSNLNGGDSMCNWACVAPYLCACGRKANHSAYVADAVATARRADVVLLTLGDTHVGEFGDRTDNSLEAPQQELLEAVCAAGTPTVVVVIAGYSIDLEYAQANCTAILFAFLPSQAGGDAVVDILLGDEAPAGRLPVTFYGQEILHERDPLDVSLRGGSGITYMHYRGKSQWAFGYGMSYTNWSFAWVGENPHADTADLPLKQQKVATTAVAAGEVRLTHTVKVTNTGKIASAITVLGFLNISVDEAQQSLIPPPPIRQLFNFTKIFLSPSEAQVVTLSVEPELLALTSWDGVRAVRPGRVGVAIGGVAREGTAETGAVLEELELIGPPVTLFSMADLREKARAHGASGA